MSGTALYSNLWQALPIFIYYKCTNNLDIFFTYISVILFISGTDSKVVCKLISLQTTLASVPLEPIPP